MPHQRFGRCDRQRSRLIGFAPLNMWAHSQQPAHLSFHNPEYHVLQRPILLSSYCILCLEGLWTRLSVRHVVTYGE